MHGTERVASGGAEGGTVMVAVSETGGADIALERRYGNDGS